MISWLKKFGAWNKEQWNKDTSGKLLVFLLWFFVIIPLILSIIFFALWLSVAGVALLTGNEAYGGERMMSSPFVAGDAYGSAPVCGQAGPPVRVLHSAKGFPY